MRGVDRDGLLRWEQPYAFHRDCEPHRARLLKRVALASVLLGLLSGCLLLPAAVGLPLGLTVWVVAGRDLARMRAGRMDPGGVEETSRAREYASVGAVLNLLTLALVGWFVFLAGSIYLTLVRPGRW